MNLVTLHRHISNCDQYIAKNALMNHLGTRRQRLHIAPVHLVVCLVIGCSAVPGCAQSPWSPQRLAGNAAPPTQNSETVAESIADGSATTQTSPSDLVVRGQEPVPGKLTSSPNSSSDASNDNANDNANVREFGAGTLIAVVGTEHILAGDMYVFVEPIIEKRRSSLTADQERQFRATLVRQVLTQYVEIKALYQEFFRDMVGNKPPKEVAEMQTKVTMKAAQIFHDKQVPELLSKYQVTDLAALERKLQEKSMSLASLQTQFTERVLSSELERKYVPDKYEFSRAELLAFYEDHSDEWNVIARAKWRELSVRFNKHSRDEAEAMIKSMGNEVYLGGAPFEAVAKQKSEGFTAADGGMYDWTSQGSLKSKAIEQAIFSLPLKRLSQVIEDEMGFHIIEVIAREPGYKKSFDAAQAEIRERLSDEKRTKLSKEFHEKVMARTSIWTLWPEDIPNSRALSEALGDAYQP